MFFDDSAVCSVLYSHFSTLDLNADAVCFAVPYSMYMYVCMINTEDMNELHTYIRIYKLQYTEIEIYTNYSLNIYKPNEK